MGLSCVRHHNLIFIKLLNILWALYMCLKTLKTPWSFQVRWCFYVSLRPQIFYFFVSRTRYPYRKTSLQGFHLGRQESYSFSFSVPITKLGLIHCQGQLFDSILCCNVSAIIFVYDYFPGAENLMSRHFNTPPTMNGYSSPFQGGEGPPPGAGARPYSAGKGTGKYCRIGDTFVTNLFCVASNKTSIPTFGSVVYLYHEKFQMNIISKVLQICYGFLQNKLWDTGNGVYDLPDYNVCFVSSIDFRAHGIHGSGKRPALLCDFSLIKETLWYN